MNSFAKYFSYLFVPPTNTIIMYIWFVLIYETQKIIPIALAILLTLVIPIVVFIYFKKSGKVQDYDASVKEERTSLYVVGIALCAIGYVISYLMNFSAPYSAFWIIYIVNTILLILINKFWKISAHMIGITVPMSIFYYFNSILFYVFIPILAILIWARLKLKMHTYAQIIAGILFGFLLTYFQLRLFL